MTRLRLEVLYPAAASPASNPDAATCGGEGTGVSRHAALKRAVGGSVGGVRFLTSNRRRGSVARALRGPYNRPLAVTRRFPEGWWRLHGWWIREERRFVRHRAAGTGVDLWRNAGPRRVDAVGAAGTTAMVRADRPRPRRHPSR